MITAAVVIASMAQSGSRHIMVVGTYTSGASEGLYLFSFDPQNGTAEKLSSIHASNPSFVAVSRNKEYVYAVNEDQPGMVSAFRYDKKNQKLIFINKQPANGDHPCYVSIDKTGKWVVAGNYSGGNFSLFEVNKDGSLKAARQTIEHTGSSVNEDRQEKPHVHATVFSPDNKYLFVTDLGTDKVNIYRFDEKKGAIKEADIPFEITEPGAGPRHFEFHPTGKYAYLIEELTGSISVYAYEKGKLKLLQNISALPRDYTGPIGSADIHVSQDGYFVYVTHRGESNTIAILQVLKNGTLNYVAEQSVNGRKPRNFSISPPNGKYILVANQDSDEIVVFRRNDENGLLTDTGKRIKVPKPVCIKWIF